MGYILNKREFKDCLNKYYKRYDKKDDLERRYYPALRADKLNEDLVENALRWKLYMKNLSGDRKAMIKRVIEQIAELNKFKCGKITDKEFDGILDKITKRTMTRIFIKHICCPDDYPIIDNYVYNAFIGRRFVGTDFRLNNAQKENYREFKKWFNERCDAHNAKTIEERTGISGAYTMWGKSLSRTKQGANYGTNTN